MAYVFVITSLAYLALKFCLGYLLPFSIGTFIAVVIQKPALSISKKTGVNKGTVALLSVVGIYIILLGVVVAISGWLYFAMGDVYKKLPEYTQSITEYFNRISDDIQSAFGNEKNVISNLLGNTITSFGETFAGYVSDFATSLLTGMPEFLLSLVVTVISGCYIAKDYEAFKTILKFALSEEKLKSVNKIKRITSFYVLKMLKGYLILTAIAFGILLTGLVMLGVNSAVRIALIVAVVDMLPVFGTGTVLIPWAAIAFIKSDTVLGVGLIIIFIVVMIVREALEPKIIGKGIGIHPLLTLLTLFLGLKFFGIVGMFLLPLIVTVVYKYYEEKVTKKSD